MKKNKVTKLKRLPKSQIKTGTIKKSKIKTQFRSLDKVMPTSGSQKVLLMSLKKVDVVKSKSSSPIQPTALNQSSQSLESKAKLNKILTVVESKEQPQSPVVIGPVEPVIFPRPQVIIYRLLNVIVDRNRLVFDLMRYAKHNLCTFLTESWTSPELLALIDLIRMESYYDSCQNEETPIIFRTSQSSAAIQDSVVMYVMWKCYRSRSAMDIGHDNPALRALLHLVILDGLITGRLVVHIEPSIAEAISRLATGGEVKQFVYSSALMPIFDGNRLLSFTDVGDLAAPFDGFFDGLQLDMRKKETYQTMIEAFQVPASAILFVSISETECKKAARAGMAVAKIREQRQKVPKYVTIKVITNIAAIKFEEVVDTTTTRTTLTPAPTPQPE